MFTYPKECQKVDTHTHTHTHTRIILKKSRFYVAHRSTAEQRTATAFSITVSILFSPSRLRRRGRERVWRVCEWRGEGGTWRDSSSRRRGTAMERGEEEEEEEEVMMENEMTANRRATGKKLRSHKHR